MAASKSAALCLLRSPLHVSLSYFSVKTLERAWLIHNRIIIGAGLYRNEIYPPVPEFPLDSIPNLHKPSPPSNTPSTAVAQPKLPFANDGDRPLPKETSVSIPDLTEVEIPKVPIDPALIALDHTRVALLMETRPLPHLPALLAHMISVLPLDWTIRFMGSPSAIELMESSRSLSGFIQTGKLLLIDIPPDLPVTSQEGISQVYTSASFYRDLLAPAEWLLVFQTDSILCAASEYSLNDWVDMGYDYVGAPWYRHNSYGGNGGLSLRHVPTIVDLLSDPDVTQRAKGDERWEDVWLAHALREKPGTKMPDAEVSSHFSVESIWSERPMGYHLRGSGIYLDEKVWRNKTRRMHIFEYCPEVKIILDTVDLDTKGDH